MYKSILIGLALAAGLLSLSAQNTVVTYQGRVQSGGSDFSGTGGFKFALVTVTNTAFTATATPTISGGFVTIITVTFGGSGYITPPAVDISGGGGSGALATANLTGGVVTSIAVNDPGSGYTSAPSVSIAPPPENLLYTTCWSNDGTSSAGSEPAGSVSVAVSNGLFTARLGDSALANMTALPPELFQRPDLQLRIWFNDGVNGFAALHPTQPLTAAPYAFAAGSASNLLGRLAASQITGTIGSTNLSGTYSGAVSFTNTGNSFSGNGAGLTSLNANQLSNGTVPDARLGASVARTNQVWLLGGNAGTTAGTHFLGTTDDEPLEIKVRGLRALRLENNGGAGAPNVIGGSPGNFVAAGVVGATIGGGGATIYTNSIWADFGVLGGGSDNCIAPLAKASIIAGGEGNDIGTNSDHAVIGGGVNNRITNNCSFAIIVGGSGNSIGTNSDYSVIGGGALNRVSPNAPYAMIVGGSANEIGTNSSHSVVIGGFNNSIAGRVNSAMIGAGQHNEIGTNSLNSVIAGGFNNEIAPNSAEAAIGGGEFNYIGTNSLNSVIGGGDANNVANSAPYATIPGGRGNLATNYAFAAGYNARALHSGAFVWSDGGGTSTSSAGSNSVTMRARNGFQFFTGSGASGAQLGAGGTSWSVLSDRNVKKDFAPVDSRAILQKLAALPITQWHYQWEDQSATPHIGPVAQDFKPAFYPGSDDKSITTQEADGVALAAIQGVNQKLEELSLKLSEQLRSKNAEITRLEQQNQSLEARLAALERVAAALQSNRAASRSATLAERIASRGANGVPCP